MCNHSLGVREPKWTSHVKRPSDVAQSDTSSDITADWLPEEDAGDVAFARHAREPTMFAVRDLELDSPMTLDVEGHRAKTRTVQAGDGRAYLTLHSQYWL